MNGASVLFGVWATNSDRNKKEPQRFFCGFQSHSGCLRFPPFCFHLVHAFLSEICNPQHDAERVKEKQQVVKAVHIVPRRAEQYHYAQHHHDDVCGGGFLSGGTLAVLLVCIHIVCRAESPAPFSVQALSRLRGQDSP